MSQCKHTEWVRLRQANSQHLLEISDRPGRILKHIRDLESPTAFVTFIGNRTKYLAISHLSQQKSHTSVPRRHGEIHLHALSASQGRQALLADGHLPDHKRLPSAHRSYRCHESRDHNFVQGLEATGIETLVDCIYQQLLLPFSDVLCLFVDDIGGISTALRRIAAWTIEPFSTCPVRPALIIVTSKGQQKKVRSAIRSNVGFVEPIHSHFRSVSVVTVSLSQKRRGQKKQLITLGRTLNRTLETVQREKSRVGFSFSARHLAAFLQTAVYTITRKIHIEPFNFIKASRRQNPVAENIFTHIKNFLSDFKDPMTLKRVGIPLLASSFILDHYPPGMHRFRAEDVFTMLYRDACIRAMEELNKGLPAHVVNLVKLVEVEIRAQFEQLLQGGSAKTLHFDRLSFLRHHWVVPSSNETCFMCIQRRPQYCLPCKHWLCQVCLRTFAHPEMGDPWLLHVDSCFLCGASADTWVRIKPDTATARVLSIDGGGVRGRAPLEFLHVLQDAVALPYPIQNNFDVIFGTSSGAMIACALCINGWSLEKCIASFETSSRLTFLPRHSVQAFKSLFGHFPPLVPAVQFIISLLVDSKYSSENLEMILKKTYGSDQRMVDSKEAARAGAMVGVTLTSTDDIKTFIATSYNGVGDRHGRHQDYEALEPVYRVAGPMWQIIRGCVAAPYYFTPCHIPGAGTFQDGGLTFNNPASIAVKEAAILFPTAKDPSIVVSQGTGSVCDGYYKIRESTLWGNSFLARLVRAFCRQGDSNIAWQHLLNLPRDQRQGEYFRFDINFDSQPPSLDDVASMPLVAQLARETALASAELQRLAKCIRAELFIFELDSARPPYFRNGLFWCTGNIVCRLRAGTEEFMTLMKQLEQSSAYFYHQEQQLPTQFALASRQSDDTNLNQRVVFQVPSRQAEFCITLRETASSTCNISGSPFTLNWLSAQQKLDAAFGTNDHR